MPTAIDWSLDPRVRSLFKYLPLPVKLPTLLRRTDLGSPERPLGDTRAIVTRLRTPADFAVCARLALHGAAVTVLDPRATNAQLTELAILGVRHAPWTMDLATVLASAGARQDRRPLLLVHRLAATPAGATAVNTATDELFQVGQAVALAPRNSRLIVLGDTPPNDDVPGRLSLEAARGCIRSLFKELGPAGSTCHLLRLDGASADAVADAVAFLAGPRAAFLTAWDVRLGADIGQDSTWSGKVVLVTGAARGIGASIAGRLAKAGATVWVNDVPQAEEAARKTAERMGSNAFVIPADCSSDAGAKSIARALSSGGRLDAVIHNAGITRDRTLKRLTLDQWRQVLSVDLASMVRVQEAVQPLMTKGGSLVLMSSVMGVAGNFGQTNYTAAKSAVLELARIWAENQAAQGIRANAIAPGFILTEMTAHMPLFNREMAKQLTALLQPGLPDDVAELATFLAGSESRSITGQVLRCDGGMFLGA
jgi:3-oxoacyl-[acyl-carrier protein] reductase